MRSARNTVLLASMFILTMHAAGQSIVDVTPPVLGFIDISTTGGTPIPSVGAESEHNIVTTIGNPLFPAGNVRISPNGVAISGLVLGPISDGNGPIFAEVLPPGVPEGGLGYVFPFWDDLQAPAGAEDTSIWWQETNSALIIMWKGLEHEQLPGGGTITFEVQVFLLPPAGSPCGLQIQYLYQDTTFGDPGFDFGNAATVGYGASYLGLQLDNTVWSFNGPGVPTGSTLTVRDEAYALTASSPQGPGSLLLSFGPSACTGFVHTSYLLAVTLNPGTFPGGWLLGLDIPLVELAGQIAAGAPFVGPLSSGTFTIGPVQGLPPFTFYCIVLGLFNGTLHGHSHPLAYTIP